ncbi:MAG: ribonuclease R [Gemmataceae bacterium]|nr:ribonuclease R [Gemmataceae bacterium]
MGRIQDKILHEINRPTYTPIKARVLARKVGMAGSEYPDFLAALEDLTLHGRVEVTASHTVKKSGPRGTVSGTYRAAGKGGGFVRPRAVDGQPIQEVRIGVEDTSDAASGDVVVAEIMTKARGDKPAQGRILRVVERQSSHFVGTYWERGAESFVRVDGTIFSHSIAVGDPTAKGAKPEDKVVFEMIRFPSPEDRGEGVITEVLGQQGQPGVDTLAIMRAFHLPDAFPPDALDEAHRAAANFSESNLEGRSDFTHDLTITIDPADARDFDDAISLEHDEKTGHWSLTVHIADVAHFVKQGGPLDREARGRATSIYLPGKVIPMFPESISNHVASLQEGRVRYVQSVVMDFDGEGRRTHADFQRGAIRVNKRFHYEEVQAFFENQPEAPTMAPEVAALLNRIRALATLLRERRKRKGALELEMPEAKLEFSRDGKVSGAHYEYSNLSHQVIEEFMLAANIAVAEFLRDLDVKFLRRIHPDPEITKLKAFAAFARTLGYETTNPEDRFRLQAILAESRDKPERQAIHFALLRSLKQAVYSPQEEGHYALAAPCYGHFTSPIRRYPDLTVHRQVAQWQRTGKASAEETELAFLGEHCSAMERRAELAERELTKIKLLDFLSTRVGEKHPAVITGVAEYGFFAQLTILPVEGLVHISNLNDDYYRYEAESHSLTGNRLGRRFRLGDEVQVEIARVDLQKRQLDFRPVLEEIRKGRAGKKR